MTESTTDARTEPTDVLEDVQEPPQEPADEAQEAEPQDEQDPAAAARREAASYRRKLRDTEGERDRLAETVAGYQRREVEALAELGRGHDRMASGADLWTAGVRVTDLLDESGAVDVEKAHAAVVAVLTERPHWRKSLWGNGDIGQGPRDTAPRGTSWSQVLGRTS